jgi:hypothetical protein
LSRENVAFRIVKVAEIQGGSYVLDAPFSDSSVDLNKIETANEMEKAARSLWSIAEEDGYVFSTEIAQTEKSALPEVYVRSVSTDSTGKALAEDLPIGVYLVYAADIAQYELIAPTLVALPSWNSITSEFDYDLSIEPKHSRLPIIEVCKVDAQTGKNITNSSFEFTSYDDAACSEKLVTEKGDTERGTAQFTMRYGTIYIKESKAPDGYKLSDEVVKCEYLKDGTMKVNDKVIEPDSNFVYSIIYQDSLLGSSGGPTESTNTAADLNAGLYIGLGIFACVLILILCFMLVRHKKGDSEGSAQV